jgi:hypothetical protein
MTQQFAITFLFVFAVVFGGMRMTGIFRNKKIDVVIAVALALFSVTDAAFASFLWENFGPLTLFFVVIFFILAVMSAFGLKDPNANPMEKMIVMGAIFFLILSLNLFQSNFFSFIPFMNAESGMLLISVVFIAVLFWLVMKTGASGKSS